METTTLSLIVIRASDVEASLTFYRALGVAFIQEQHGTGPVHYSCDFGGMVFELYPSKAEASQVSSTDTTMLGFQVASLEKTLAQLQRLGIEPVSAPKDSAWGRWVNVIDPSGRPIQIYEATT